MLTVRATVRFFLFCIRTIMQWLRQEGADWPDELQCEGVQWPDASIAWCRAEGCDSPLLLEVEETDDDNDIAFDIDDDDDDDAHEFADPDDLELM
jgi:hypothetical protein